MSTETTNKKIKIDNGTTFGKTYTDKAIDAKLPTDLIATANKLSLGVGNAPLGNGVNLDGFTYDEATKTLKASGGEGGVAEIVLSDSQMQTLSSTYSITFTDEQANILENTVDFKWTYNGTEIARGTGNKLFFGGSVSYGLNLFVNGRYHYFYTGDDNFDSLTKELTLGSVNIGEAITEENIIIASDNSTIQFGTKPIRFVTINGEGLIQDSTGVSKDYSFTEDKVISLFGKHSILVSKDSADTAIDLYIHNIVLKDNAETTTKKIYLTVQSTTNTPATTKELLQTLLGSTSRYIRVSGYTPTNDISAINWAGTFDTSKYDVRGTETSLTDFTVIEDSVVTL